MSRIGRILPLGAALLVASCADGTGPSQDLEHPPLGAISGPGVSTAELHTLAHQMEMVSPYGLPMIQEGVQPSEGVTELESYELSFWAKRGEPRTIEVDYADDYTDDNQSFLRFHVPATALFSRPDGTHFANGDSVLISINIDRSEFVAEFGPSGLVFNSQTPAELDVWYSGAEGEVPQKLLNIWHQQDAGELWYPILSTHDLEQKWLRTQVFHFSTYAVSW